MTVTTQSHNNRLHTSPIVGGSVKVTQGDFPAILFTVGNIPQMHPACLPRIRASCNAPFHRYTTYTIRHLVMTGKTTYCWKVADQNTNMQWNTHCQAPQNEKWVGLAPSVDADRLASHALQQQPCLRGCAGAAEVSAHSKLMLYNDQVNTSGQKSLPWPAGYYIGCAHTSQ